MMHDENWKGEHLIRSRRQDVAAIGQAAKQEAVTASRIDGAAIVALAAKGLTLSEMAKELCVPVSSLCSRIRGMNVTIADGRAKRHGK